jgi:hypothetical protein
LPRPSPINCAKKANILAVAYLATVQLSPSMMRKITLGRIVYHQYMPALALFARPPRSFLQHRLRRHFFIVQKSRVPHFLRPPACQSSHRHRSFLNAGS